MAKQRLHQIEGVRHLDYIRNYKEPRQRQNENKDKVQNNGVEQPNVMAAETSNTSTIEEG